MILSLILALLAAPLPAEGQQPVIGFVRSSSIEAVPHIVTGFRQGLRETGYVEGQNVAIERQLNSIQGLWNSLRWLAGAKPTGEIRRTASSPRDAATTQRTEPPTSSSST